MQRASPVGQAFTLIFVVCGIPCREWPERRASTSLVASPLHPHFQRSTFTVKVLRWAETCQVFFRGTSGCFCSRFLEPRQ
jgi:hypothetical protein